jgi:inactivated superfamily I helicase
MLLNSTQGIPRSQHEEESLLLGRKIEEESSLLRRKIEELNQNTVLLIAEAGKLIQGSKQLSDRLKSFENPSTKRKVA